MDPGVVMRKESHAGECTNTGIEITADSKDPPNPEGLNGNVTGKLYLNQRKQGY